MPPPPRRLLVMRHATAEPRGPTAADIDRPLTPAGRDLAARRGPVVAALNPQLILCSTAVRARQTLEAMALPDLPVSHERSLYSGGAEAILHLLAAQRASVRRLLLIGHLPSVALVVNGLLGATAVGHGFRPGSLAVVDLRVGWGELSAGVGELHEFHQ